MDTTKINPSSYRIALLAGGKSTEREISLMSGESAKYALEQAGFAVDQFDPAQNDDMKRLAHGNYDVAFLCVHGKYGEDGTLQRQLEEMGLKYTGSGIQASANAMNKSLAKDIYRQYNIPTAPSCTVYRGDDCDVAHIADIVGGHCLAKASSGGSTIGIFVANCVGEISDCIEQVFVYDDEVLVEKFIEGDEFTVSVLGNDEVEALPVIQIVPKSGFYDFEAKYTVGGSTHLCPAPIDDRLTERLKDLACRAHKALGCRGVSRTDILVDKQGKCWVLETNTIPGMTSTSLLPDAARVAGIDFPDLCTMLVSLALE